MIERQTRIAAMQAVRHELAALRGEDDRDGLCPECGQAEAFIIHKVNMAGCREHKVCWQVGINLYSGWQHQPEEIWQENANLLATFKQIPISEAVYSKDQDNQNRILELTTKLQGLEAEHKERFFEEVKAGLAATLQPLAWFERITSGSAHEDGRFALAGRMAKAAREQLECISVVLDCEGVPEEELPF